MLDLARSTCLTRAFLLISAEELLAPYAALSGLLAVVSMACVVKLRCPECVTQRLSQKSGKLWIAAEAVLFVLVGAAVDVRYMAGLACGNIVLTVAVLGIVITAPLGAFLIDFTYKRLLKRTPREEQT